MPITIYIKNMAGEIFPMEVEPSASLLEIAKQMSARDPEPFPPGKTKVMRMEEKENEPLVEEEMLLAYVSPGPFLESGVYPNGGKPYQRWVIPFRERTLYLYMHSHYIPTSRKPIYTSAYSASWTPQCNDPTDSHSAYATVFYTLMLTVVEDITPEEMSMLYELVLSYDEQLKKEKGITLKHAYDPSEPMLCACGSIVQRVGMYSHKKTKKHTTWETTQ